MLFEDVMLPLTFKVVKVPTLVIDGWAAVVTVAAVVAVEAVPFNEPVNDVAVIVPLALCCLMLWCFEPQDNHLRLCYLKK